MLNLMRPKTPLKFYVGTFLVCLGLMGCERDQEQESSHLPLETLILEIVDKVRQDYVEDVNQEKLIEGALNGILTTLDPYSCYLNATDYKNLTDRTKGEFAGIGLEILATKGMIKVIAAIDDTPAQKAGLQAGDVITHINNQDVHKLSSQESLALLQGSPSTEVCLTIVRTNCEPFIVKIKRAIIQVNPIRSTLMQGIGYVRISSFSENVSKKLKETLETILHHNPKLPGLILDLRDNPGGTLDQAIAVASCFLNSGLIVEIRSRNPTYNQSLQSKGKDFIRGIPMVVLINKGSASASEIVAGALRDHKRAVIMGTRSFGKGSVQTLFSIPGYGGIRLTTARFFTPKGQPIQDQGIEPDIIIDLPQNKGESKKTPSLETTTSKEEIDIQLQRAVDLLHGLSVLQK